MRKMSPERMMKRNGFTLIELLIAVAIVGILTAILVPILQGAVQKARQKGTMGDINSLSKAIMTFMTDTGRPPANPNGPLQAGQQFILDLAGLHLAEIPLSDQWGNRLRVWTGTACGGQFGIPADGVGLEDFLVQSFGSDGQDEGFAYTSSNPQDFYELAAMDDFKKDLIMWNGSFIHAPRGAQSGT
jgi:prepilin-type N-terminal cleavage/methylation domain-containing protein